eukprot:10238443-Alexandrium_andersonii.AAC.1
MAGEEDMGVGARIRAMIMGAPVTATALADSSLASILRRASSRPPVKRLARVSPASHSQSA